MTSGVSSPGMRPLGSGNLQISRVQLVEANDQESPEQAQGAAPDQAENANVDPQLHQSQWGDPNYVPTEYEQQQAMQYHQEQMYFQQMFFLQQFMFPQNPYFQWQQNRGQYPQQNHNRRNRKKNKRKQGGRRKNSNYGRNHGQDNRNVHKKDEKSQQQTQKSQHVWNKDAAEFTPSSLIRMDEPVNPAKAEEKANETSLEADQPLSAPPKTTAPAQRTWANIAHQQKQKQKQEPVRVAEKSPEKRVIQPPIQQPPSNPPPEASQPPIARPPQPPKEKTREPIQKAPIQRPPKENPMPVSTWPKIKASSRPIKTIRAFLKDPDSSDTAEVEEEEEDKKEEEEIVEELEPELQSLETTPMQIPEKAPVNTMWAKLASTNQSWAAPPPIQDPLPLPKKQDPTPVQQQHEKKTRPFKEKRKGDPARFSKEKPKKTKKRRQRAQQTTDFDW